MTKKNRRGVLRVTPELYAEIKSKLHSPSDDERVIREYGISKTTAKAIRNSKDFKAYHEKAMRQRAERELDKITRNAKYDRKEETENEAPKAPKIGIAVIEHQKEEESNTLAQIVGVFLVVCLMLIVGGITLGVLRWALGF